MQDYLQLHPLDNVGVLFQKRDDINPGHKIALKDIAAGEKVMNALKLAAIAVHVADVRTCVLHPASHTHRQLTDEQLEAAGVGADLIRLSCGLENAEDLIADIAQALEAVK